MEGKISAWGLFLATLLAFLATLIIMFRVDPYKAGMFEKFLFFASFLIGAAGFVQLVLKVRPWDRS